MQGNYKLAEQIRGEIEKIPGAVDVHIKQAINGPVINVNVDRQKAAQLGYTQKDIAGSMLVSLSSSFQTAPNFWVNPKNGVIQFGCSNTTETGGIDVGPLQHCRHQLRWH